MIHSRNVLPLLVALLPLAACSSTPSTPDAAPATDTPAADTPSADVVADASPDAPSDAAPDAPADVAMDAPVDASPDAPADAAMDAPADVAPDVAVDAPPSRCAMLPGPASWAIENPLPIDLPFTRVFAVAPGDVYAASSTPGASRHWTPAGFEATGSGRSVWAASATEVFFAGADGVARGAGTMFTNTPLGGALLDISGSGASNVVAVGAGGQIQRWNGTAWAPQASGVTNELPAVWVRSTDDAWAAVRAVGGMSAPAVLRWNGTAWSPVSRATFAGLGDFSTVTSIWGSGPDDVYFCATSSPVIHWDGMAYTRVLTADVPDGCTGVGGSSATDVWFASRSTTNGPVHRYDGHAVTHPWPTGPLQISTVHVASPTLAAFGGEGGMLATWDGMTFTVRSSGYRDNVERVWVAPTGEAYAQGPGGIYFGDCGTWTQAPGVPGSHGDVSGVSATQVWFGAVGGVRRVNGTRFVVGPLEPYGIGAPTDITYAVWAASATSVYATGQTRPATGSPTGWVRHWNGTSWQDITPPEYMMSGRTGPRRITGFGDTAVFMASTTNGSVLRWDGTRWNTEATGVTSFVQDLVALPGGELLALTTNTDQSRRRSASGTWSTAGFATGLPTFQRAYAVGARDVYATRYYDPPGRTSTYLWHWDGATWTELSIHSDYLDDVAGGSPSDVVAVGNVGRIWRYGRR